MDKLLLDTDTLSEILKGKNLNIIHQANNYFQKFGQYTISTITVLEIIKGFHKVQRENHIEQFLSTLSNIEILTLNLKSAELAGRVYADLERTGQPIGRADPMIAAVALENNLVLVTGNLRHYQRIQKLGYPLKLDNWKLKETLP
ncbi:type II toxin-antitoxin system VapC family toxin [Candidatus Parabeggiatoa sp. HSG14]|uniref:type II toxin-antitoxin system VapC family toxin n=1 Tax=Candidatus Parabeggiatoa sp. HSG14 TaxID=3055593 RepID=UPI0025A88CC5|nr:type II toxin-antitoxin system VapC family toxin [Thiotrichales bacterium HSG14]